MGGSGLDTLSYAIAIEEIAKACAGTAVRIKTIFFNEVRRCVYLN